MFFPCSSQGQFSILGAQLAIQIIAKENSLTVLNHAEGSREERVMEDPMSAPGEITAKWTLSRWMDFSPCSVVSKSGSAVEKLMEVERYSHVMHLSSTVRLSSRLQSQPLRNKRIPLWCNFASDHHQENAKC